MMNSLITINDIYYLIGLIVMLQVGMTLSDRHNPKRYTTALFWFCFGAIFLFGDLLVSQLGNQIAYRIVGVLVILIALLAGTGQLAMGRYSQRSDTERQGSASKLGNRLFLPAVMIPVATVLSTVLLGHATLGDYFVLDQKNITLTSLAIGTLAALLLGWRLTGGTPLQAVRESRRLVDSIGWAAILPQMLAMLGGVFVVAQTGESVKEVVNLFVTPDNLFLMVTIYCVGMALFTMIMGNAFAAFPVMTAGIAIPFLIMGAHGNPAAVVAIGMLSGYCGTLMTPMGANYNIVPAALLELDNKYQVILVQIPTAILMLGCNILLMYFLAFR